MHGLGNDFVIIDQRKQDINLNKNLIQRIADRNKGVGFDQLALILSSNEADAELVFFNSDGSKSRTCGNATRCIAKHLMQEKKTNNLHVVEPKFDSLINVLKDKVINKPDHLKKERSDFTHKNNSWAIVVNKLNEEFKNKLR